MNRDEVESKVKLLIQHSIDGFEVESSKVDFKLNWYDLSDKKRGVNEFIKDVTAIANTIGLDGFVIIGYEEKNKTFKPAKFSDCGLGDSTEIQNLIIRRCSNIFTVNTFDFIILDHPVSVIHIPPTIDKPIFVLDYKKYDKLGNLKKTDEQRVFVRKNSMNSYASKNDLELMYYDRKNLSPDYYYELNLLNYSASSVVQPGSGLDRRTTFLINTVELVFNIENLGKRNLALNRSRILINSDYGEIIMESFNTAENSGSMKHILDLISTIKPNESKKLRIGYVNTEMNIRIESVNFYDVDVELTLANGKLIGGKYDLKNKGA